MRWLASRSTVRVWVRLLCFVCLYLITAGASAQSPPRGQVAELSAHSPDWVRQAMTDRGASANITGMVWTDAGWEGVSPLAEEEVFHRLTRRPYRRQIYEVRFDPRVLPDGRRYSSYIAHVVFENYERRVAADLGPALRHPPEPHSLAEKIIASVRRAIFIPLTVRAYTAPPGGVAKRVQGATYRPESVPVLVQESPMGYEYKIPTGAQEEGGSHLPWFPWPPPRASAWEVIPQEFLVSASGSTNLLDVDRRITEALEQNGYFDASYYEVPSGFALVTRIEHIDSDGKPKPDRWAVEPTRSRPFSLSDYLKALFTATPGYYRLVVFVVSPDSIVPSDVEVTAEEAFEWFTLGGDRLPEWIGRVDFAGYACTALIYEFERSTEEDKPEIRSPGRIQARVHLELAGIWGALQQ